MISYSFPKYKLNTKVVFAAALCIFVLARAIVPVGFMFNASGGDNAFVLCPSDSLSAQILAMEEGSDVHHHSMHEMQHSAPSDQQGHLNQSHAVNDIICFYSYCGNSDYLIETQAQDKEFVSVESMNRHSPVFNLRRFILESVRARSPPEYMPVS